MFSLKSPIAEPSPSKSACQAYLALDTIENFIRVGGDIADGWVMARKQDELDRSINFLQLIDGLLIKKAVSEKQKQVVHSVEPETAPAPGMFALNRGAGWKELPLMVDQGKVVSSCGTIPEEPFRKC